jgi:hypothetical protein
MAHHKRGKCKNARSGCLWCKPHKSNSSKDSFNNQTRQEKLAIISEKEQMEGEPDGAPGLFAKQ